MTLRRLTALAILAFLWLPVVAAAQAAQANVSGSWTGSFKASMDGGPPSDDTAHITLVQTGTTLTGSAGPNPDRQYPISKGKVETDKDGGVNLMFEVLIQGEVLATFQLKLVEGRLKGEAKAAGDGHTMSAAIDVGRVK